MCSLSENLRSLRQAVFTRLLPCDWLVWCLCSQASPLYTLARQYWNCDIFFRLEKHKLDFVFEIFLDGQRYIVRGKRLKATLVWSRPQIGACERSLWLRNLLVSNDLFCQTSKGLFFLLSFFSRTQTSIFKGVSGSVADANERWTDISLLLRPLCCLVAD